MDFVACESVTERVFVCVQCLCVQCLCVCGCILYTVGQQVSVVFLSLRITYTHTLSIHWGSFKCLFSLQLLPVAFLPFAERVLQFFPAEPIMYIPIQH